ncbi:MAG TPA: hypothetical protein PLB25_09455 [Rhodoferax sp.]|nr:hypothetical protein [Rhodoferax sp.]
MAQLTPLSKGLLGLLVIGGMASAAWHLGLKERFGAMLGSAAPPVLSAPDSAASEVSAPPAAVAPVAVTPAAAQPERLEQRVSERQQPAPIVNHPQPQAGTSKSSSARADPWAELKIDKKGNSP